MTGGQAAKMDLWIVARSAAAAVVGDEPSRSRKAAVGSRIRDACAGWSGLMIHRIAGKIRGVVAANVDADPANIAVMCDAFLRYGSAQAAALSQTGLNVTLYYVDKVNEFGGNAADRALFLDRARASGVQLVPLPRRSIRSLFKHTIWLHRDLRRRKIATAIVQSHIDPRYATLGLALPVALIIHDPRPHSGDVLSTYPLPVRMMARFAELTSFCLVIHSVRLFDQVWPLLRRLPFGVVPHGAEMALAPADIPEERTLLVFGRLFEYKGVDTALDAFHLLADEISDTKLIVAGRGPLAELARGLPNVELRDEYISDADIDALLDRARLVLLPYKDATQSGVGLQAVARGIPCVVSSAGALPELMHGTQPSLVVPPDDPSRLAEAIKMYIDHDESLRKAVYDHAAVHFTWTVAAQQLRSELKRLALDGQIVQGAACTGRVGAES